MWDLGTINSRNVAEAERRLASQGKLAPKRPGPAATGHCAECGRDVAHESWDGVCNRCEPLED